MSSESGIVLAMSPVQMAAVMSDRTVSEGETLSNRLYGGLGLLGGVAEMFGADRNTAMHVGMTVDLAVPMSFALAIGGVRIAAIRAGRIRLADHEAIAVKGAGGHTLERHIGKTPEELIARLERRPGLNETSSFRTVGEAEKLIDLLPVD